MNNNGFILLDALIAFMILASFLFFFNQVVVISQKQQMSYMSETNSINALREKAYEMYTDKNIVKQNDVKIFKKGNSYCAKYDGVEKEEEICV